MNIHIGARKSIDVSSNPVVDTPVYEYGVDFARPLT